MSWVTVIWSMGASACLTLAVMYFVVWWKNRTTQAHLLLSLTAASTAVFAFFELSIMRAQTPQQLDAALDGLRCQCRWGCWPDLVRVDLSGCRAAMARLDYLRPARFLCAAESPDRGNAAFHELPSLQRIQFLGESVTISSGTPTPLGMLAGSPWC